MQVLGSAMQLVAKGVILAMLPRFVDLLTRDYQRWASDADRGGAVGSLTAALTKPEEEEAATAESAEPPASVTTNAVTERTREEALETASAGHPSETIARAQSK